ncbi:MAG: methyltransferase domain-containing protein [Patescibacteria group bacterium]|nr:methyltransferase domain-containing protein [Patescibacteria group bacterium]
MRYFFILGTNPTLSLAELTAVFNHGQFSLIQKNIAILETNEEIKANIIKKIGGTVKFGLIHGEPASIAVKDILKSATSFAKPEKSDSKFNFGISYYGKSKINLKVLGMEFKKLLKESGINSRWVISREPTLSSVVVEQNKLVTDKGVEIVIIEFNKKLLLGKTLAVQPFKELSFRDYGRPARDDYSGMLPPKLAQIMINLAGADLGAAILDPFCGSGTIITEAALMGYKKITGSDISDRALGDTKNNLAWVQSNFKLEALNFKLFHSDAAQISKHIAPNSIDFIITEPYLGPQRGNTPINKIKTELEKLYSESLREFKKILKPGGKIVMIWPVFQGKLSTFIYPNIDGYKIIGSIPANLKKNIFLKITNRDSIIYGRDGQKVWREIVILEK